MKIISRKLNSKIHRTITHKGDIECGAWQTDGKYFEIKVAKSDRPVEEAIEEICDKLLANVNMETYRYEIVATEEV